MASGSQNNTTYQAQKWTNLRAFTIGDTAKNVDGTAAVSWDKDEILGASTDAYFLRGDKVWSNALSANFSAGTYILAGTYLQARNHMYLDAGHFYMKYNNTWYDVLHNHVNGNISVNAAGTGLYVGYYNTTLVDWMSGRMQLKDGCLSIFPNSSNYREGIRIHSVGSWSDIILCGNDNTGDSGISANSWFIGNNNGNFYIARNGSPGSTAYIGCVSNVWKFVTSTDIPEGAANLSAAATAHTLSIYRNGITIPYQMDNANDGGMLRVKGSSESNTILELGTWDDSGSGETIQFNYYPTTSQVTPTYSVKVPKRTGSIFLAQPWWTSGNGNNVNDLRGGSTFAYTNHNAPTTGMIVAFDCDDSESYTLQLQGNYSGEALYYRNRNGDKGTWNTWRQLVHNAGTWGISITGNAETVSRATFGDASHETHDASSMTSNGLYYYNSNGPATSQGAKSTDGALYAQAYSTAWVGQIAQDYRNGYLFVRGKNNNSWTSWLHVLNTDTGVSRYHVGDQDSNSYILVTINPETSWMLNFTLKLYQSYVATDIQISGYNYGTNLWYSPQACILGSTSTSAIKVYFGYTANWKLWVAVDGGSYNGADVVDMCNGYTQIDPANAFTLTKVNSLPGTTQTTVTVYRPWYRDETVSNASYATTSGSCSGNAATATTAASCSGNAATATKATNDGDGNKISTTYAKIAAHNNLMAAGNEFTFASSGFSGGTWFNYRTAGGMNGNITEYIFGNGKGGSLASITSGTFNGNVSGSSSSCTGNAATATRINGNLAAATSDVVRNIWVSSTAGADGIPNYISGFYMNPSTKVFTVPASTRISPSAGALYLGNSGNQSWVYVQDMCSQDGQKWKILQNGNAEFNGTVTVGGTLTGSSTITGQLQSTAGIHIYTNASGGQQKIWFREANGTYKWRIGVDANDRFSISAYADGEGSYDFWVYNNGACYYKTSIGASSRYIKHNIHLLTMDTGNIIDRMEPVSFVFNNDQKETINLGFIYEDLVEILPEVCFHGEGEDNNLGINYSGIIPVLVKELQSLRKRLAAVETELNSYKSKT